MRTAIVLKRRSLEGWIQYTQTIPGDRLLVVAAAGGGHALVNERTNLTYLVPLEEPQTTNAPSEKETTRPPTTTSG